MDFESDTSIKFDVGLYCIKVDGEPWRRYVLHQVQF